MNGYALNHLSAKTVVPDVYPHAQPFHWSVLWQRLEDCRKIASISNGDTNSLSSPRKLNDNVDDSGSDQSSGSGIKINHDQATIWLGVDGDVRLTRLADRVLALENNLRFCDGDGVKFCNTNDGNEASITSDGNGNIIIDGDLKFGAVSSGYR